MFVFTLFALLEILVSAEKIEIKDAKYLASLQINGTHICAASIISPLWILTTASCIQGVNRSELKVHVGATDIHNAKEGQMISVQIVHMHPKYEYPDFDCAVLGLSYPVLESDNAGSISINKDNPVEGENAALSGWKPDGTLRNNQIAVIPLDQCRLVYETINGRMVCGQSGDIESPCKNDNGGPLVRDGKLVGIVTNRNGCNQTNVPSVFTNVAAMYSFISNMTGVHWRLVPHV